MTIPTESPLKNYGEFGHFRPDNAFFDNGYAAFFGVSTSVVYFAICRYSDPKTATCQQSDSDISNKTGLSRRSIISARQSLEAYNIISVNSSRGRGHKNIITLIHRDKWVKCAAIAFFPPLKCEMAAHIEPLKCEMAAHIEPLKCEMAAHIDEQNVQKTTRSNIIIGNKKKEEEREIKKENALTPEHPNLQIYHKIFGRNGLTIFQEEQISALSDSSRWEKACIFWKAQDYRAGSIGRLIERYHEEGGTSKNTPRKATKQTQYEENKQLLEGGDYTPF